MRVARHRYAVDGWGVGELWVRDGLVLAHDLDLDPDLDPDLDLDPGASRAATEPSLATDSPLGGAGAPERTITEKPSRVGDDLVANLVQRIHTQLAGHETSFADVPLDLSWCTSFQADLARALRQVPWGDVVTYGELAAHAGRPGAARAAGTFCAQNRFWLFLPCHRVVAAGGIGGYGSAGVACKRRLLALEDVAL